MRIMSQAEPTSVAIALLKERDRDALVERLTATLADLALDEAVAFLADLLLAAGADRDRLKERVVSLLSSRFGRRSEKSSDDQLQLFAQALIRENIRRCRAENTRLIARDARRLGPGSPHDLIFLDPPYGAGLGEAALARALEGGWIAPGALIVWEESAPITPPPQTKLLESRAYGATTLSFLRTGAG